MKILKLIIFLFFFFPYFAHSQTEQNIYLNCAYYDIPFSKFVDEVERQSNLKFYFKQEWIDSIRVNVVGDSIPLYDVMQSVLNNSSVNYYFVEPNKIYLLPNHNMIYPLPPYGSNNSDYETTENEEVEQLQIEKKYIKGRETDMVGTLIIGSSNKSRPGKMAILNGKLEDIESGEPIIGGTIFFKDLKKGTATDSHGSLNIAVPVGEYSVVFQCLGMEELKYIFDVRSTGYFTIKMKKEMNSLAEVTVNAKESYKRGSTVGLERVSIKSIKELPTLMGEKDVIKISQMLPGIVSVSEGSAGINVRGGNADQNLFYINEVPVYNTSHLFGFFSAINSTIIDDFSIYKGHVPVKYGGRLSSIFNIETRKGNKKKFFTQGGVSPIAANIEIEAPLVKEKCSFMLSGRSSYSNWILKKMEDPALRNSSASFYDFAGAVDYEINKTNHLSLFAYNSYDFFSLDGLTDYDYTNKGAAISYIHRFSPSLKSTVTLTSTNYEFSTTDKKEPSKAYTHKYLLEHYEVKGELSWMLNEKHSISAGGNLILYNLNRGDVNPYGQESLKQSIPLGEEQGVESAIYIDERYTISSWLNVYAGIRYSSFSYLGPKTVLTYRPNAAKNEINIEDTLSFQTGEKIINYSSPELRFAVDFKIGALNSIKLSFNQMRQYLFMLSNSFSISPTDQWKLVDYHIKPPKSSQIAFGYYRQLPSLGLSVSTELYYKTENNIVEYKDGVDFLSNSQLEKDVLQGDQEAYGLELMISKEKGKLNGWISYTYSRSKITVDGENEWDKINDGKTYPSNYDKPNVFNLIANYKINRRLGLSANLQYSTGRPITLPEAIYQIEGRPYVDYSSRNEYRIPDYFRVDMSLTIEGNLKSKKAFHNFWMISVYNMTGQQNAYSVYFRSEERVLRGYKYSIIGVPIFTISWNFKLGNFSND